MKIFTQIYYIIVNSNISIFIQNNFIQHNFNSKLFENTNLKYFKI